MALKVAVFHADSHFGRHLSEFLKVHNTAVFSPDAIGLDCVKSLIDVLAAERPDVAVSSSYNVSPARAQILVEACQALQLPCIHLSTHEVFGSLASETPYDEPARPTPHETYAQSLLATEDAFAQWQRSIVLRLPWVSDTPDGVLFKICEKMISGDVVVSDQWLGCPVDTATVARVVYAMALQVSCGAENWGVYHVRSSDHCSEAELADYVRRVLVKAGCPAGNILVGSITQRLVESNGWLTGNRCTNDFGIQLRSWRQGIKTRVMQWLARQVDEGRVELHPEATDSTGSQ